MIGSKEETGLVADGQERPRPGPDPLPRARGAVDAARVRPDHRGGMSLLSTYRNALPPGSRILWYRIERVLGQGAFGITYLAYDDNLRRAVAIKEYLPGHLARREADLTIQPLTMQLADEYTSGLHRFLSEARTLARFEHPNIVRVHNVFEHKLTAYMVMQHEEGEGLDRLLREVSRLDEAQLKTWLPGLLDGLETIHAQGYVHRDIKPANVLIRTSGEPVLLDFGSARHATPEDAKTLTNFVSPGYAPIEQYAGKSDQQGPWTDIYGLGATLYRAMSGRPPPDAVERSHALAQQESDTYQPAQLAFREHYSPGFITAIDHALCFRMQDRPQTVAAWRDEFLLPAPEPARTASIVTRAVATRPPLPRPEDAEQPTRPADLAMPLVSPPTAPGTVVVPRSSLFAGGALLAALLIGVVVLARQLPDPEVAPLHATPSATDRQPLDDAALTLAARVEDLLARAAADVEAERYTEPAGANAYEKYRDVLALEPSNAAAQRGIAHLARRYLELTRRDIEAGRYARAEHFLTRAETLDPGRLETIAVREALTQRRSGVVPGPAAPAAASNERAATTETSPADSGWRAPIEERAPPPRRAAPQ